MQKALWQRILFQVHLWGGLSLGIYAFLIGATGSVLVFREEIASWMAPIPEQPDQGPALRMEEIRAKIQTQSPGWYVWSLEAPVHPGGLWSSYLLQKGRGKLVVADGQGRLLGERRLEHTWLGLVDRFHSFLLIPKGGRLYNGIAGLTLLLVVISGITLWWPKQGEWSSALRIIRRSNWKSLNYDLHRVGGAFSFGFVILFCITGAYFTWPGVYRDIASNLLPTKPKLPKVSVSFNGTRLSIDSLAETALQSVPGTKLVRILVPEGRNAPVTVVLAHGPIQEHRTTSQVQLHPETGQILSVDDFRQRRAGDHLVSWLGPLHTGHFGSFAWKVVWALVGLSFPALFITGLMMWCNRVLVPRLAASNRVTPSVSR